MPVDFCGQCDGAKYGDDIDFCDCRYRSIVLWPDSVKLGKIPNESRDEHDSKAAAHHVCRMLRKKGLGLQGKIFPISTRVERISDV